MRVSGGIIEFPLLAMDSLMPIKIWHFCLNPEFWEFRCIIGKVCIKIPVEKLCASSYRCCIQDFWYKLYLSLPPIVLRPKFWLKWWFRLYFGYKLPTTVLFGYCYYLVTRHKHSHRPGTPHLALKTDDGVNANHCLPRMRLRLWWNYAIQHTTTNKIRSGPNLTEKHFLIICINIYLFPIPQLKKNLKWRLSIAPRRRLGRFEFSRSSRRLKRGRLRSSGPRRSTTGRGRRPWRSKSSV